MTAPCEQDSWALVEAYVGERGGVSVVVRWDARDSTRDTHGAGSFGLCDLRTGDVDNVIWTHE